MIPNKLYNWIFKHSLYVIAVAADNSITLSYRLFRRMRVMECKKIKVYVFYIPSVRAYAFTLNPSLDKPTQMCDIQYNSKHHCFGFETLCPTVNRIFYDYGLKHNKSVKLSVRICTAPNNIVYYQICRPNEKSVRN